MDRNPSCREDLGSAAQPACKKVKLPPSSGEASSSAAQPADKQMVPKQSSGKVALSSAAQPARKKVKLATRSGEASSSAAQPAAHTATLLEQVQQLGHYPNRCKKPTCEQQRK